MSDPPAPFQSSSSSSRCSPHTTISDDDMDQPLPLPTQIYAMTSDPYHDTTTKVPGLFTRWLDPQTPDTMAPLLWPSYGADDMHINDDTKFHMIDSTFHTNSCGINTSDSDSPGMIFTNMSLSETLTSEKGSDDDYFSHQRFKSPAVSPPSLPFIHSETPSNETITSDKYNAKRPQLRRHSTSSSGSNSSIGARSHECGYCSRTFARRHDLERHTRVHTGIKPYVCPCCLRAFIRSDARGRHFRSEKACREGPEILAFIKRNIRNTL